MSGCEPFLLCDFHAHTRWSDGKLTIAEVVDLYGSTGKFDVIAITDHILMKNDLLARAGKLATLGRRAFGVREQDFQAYLDDIEREARRARERYGMLLIPGAEATQNRLRGKKNSHIIALGIRAFISADQPADAILREIRRQGALSIACHPHHRTTRRIEISTCYLWDHRDELAGLVDVWEAANRDGPVLGDQPQALPLCRQQRFPQAQAPLFAEDAGAEREDLAGDQPRAPQQRRRCPDPLPKRLLGRIISA